MEGSGVSNSFARFDSLPHSADGGDRTHTLLPVLDFESSASANSATSAFCEEATCNPFAAKRKRTSQEDGTREPVGRSSGAPWKGHLNPVDEDNPRSKKVRIANQRACRPQ